MMRGIIVVVTCAMAMIFLGEKRYVHHYISVLVIVGGVGIVGLTAISNSDDDPHADHTPTKPLGVILLLIA